MEHLPVAHIRAMLESSDADALDELLDSLAQDERPGVRAAIRRTRARLKRQQSEHARAAAMLATEMSLRESGLVLIAGVDEVGRGALAGPVSAGAVVFADAEPLPGLRDSKTLSRDARSRLDALVRDRAYAVSVAHVDAAVIDAIGIAAATVQAMREALTQLGCSVEHVLVDGLDVPLALPHTAIVKGDASVRPIAAAAIVAKVARDALMEELGDRHPGYDLGGNKGYGSPGHLDALASLGPSPVHRLSFAPCAQRQLF